MSAILKRAAALAALPSARDRSDFLPRAAACHAVSAVPGGALGMNVEMVWPGHMADFAHDISSADHLALAEALIALARDAEAPKKAGA